MTATPDFHWTIAAICAICMLYFKLTTQIGDNLRFPQHESSSPRLVVVRDKTPSPGLAGEDRKPRCSPTPVAHILRFTSAVQLDREITP
jgi:hypothetical protein